MLSPRLRVRDFQILDTCVYPIEVSYGSGGNVDDTAVLFKQFNPIPSYKMMTFVKNEPFSLQLRYASIDLLPSGTNPDIGTFKVPYYGENGEKVKVKVKINLDGSGIISVPGAILVEDAKVEEPAQAPQADSNSNPAESELPDGTSEPSGDGPSGDAMEVDKDVAQSEKDKKSKKVVKRNVEVISEGVGGLTPQRFQECFEMEVNMANTDRVIVETLQLKNSLEARIYELRDTVALEVGSFMSEKEKDAIIRKCDDDETWLFTEGESAQRSDFQARLAALQELITPALSRQYEWINREEALTYAKKLAFINHQNVLDEGKQYEHIEREEMKKLEVSCLEFERWLDEIQNKQSHLSKQDNPVVTVAEIRRRCDELQNHAKSILNKPKPVPKAQPEVEIKNDDGKQVMDVDANNEVKEANMEVDDQQHQSRMDVD